MFGTKRTGPSVWDDGWGLPIFAGGFSLVISSAVFSSFLATAGVIELPKGWFEFHFAALAFLSQWGANTSLLRASKNIGGRRALFLLAFAILSVCSGFGVHHVQSAYRDGPYLTQVEARAAARAPDEAIIAASRQAIANANREIAANSARGREENWPAQRIDSFNAGPSMLISNARLDIAEANQRLEDIGPAMSPTRPWDNTDTLFAALCVLIGVLEFVFYWGMHGEQHRVAPQPVPPPPPNAPQAALAKPRPKWWLWLTGALAGAGFSLAPQALAQTPVAPERQTAARPEAEVDPAPQTLAAPADPAPPEPAEVAAPPAVRQPGERLSDEELTPLVKAAHRSFKSERATAAHLTTQLGYYISRDKVRTILGRKAGTANYKRRGTTGRQRAAIAA